MDFVVSHLWLWLLIAVASYGYVIFNQVRRMKRVWNGPGNGSFFSGIGLMMAAAMVGSVSGILFVIALIGSLIQYAK